MSYEFLTKAQSQPDLSDFCEYVQKPLSILEDIQKRYKKLQLAKKVEPENLEIYHKVDVILEKHLPEMVDTYCNFSFDFRNNKNLDMQGYSSLTAKELLLKNLAKVIEEIEIIEKDFNRNNSFHAVVQNKVLNSYGYQPELCLETGKLISNNLQLNNKFDYERFVEENQFKKELPIPVTNLNLTTQADEYFNKNFEKTEEKKPIFAVFSSFIFQFLLTIGLSILVFIGFARMYSSELEEKAVANLSNIRKEVKSLNPDNNYDGIYIGQLSSYKSFGNSLLELSPITIEKENDAFAIKFKAEEGYLKGTCEAISTIVDEFDIIKINNFVFKNGKPVSQEKFESYCENSAFGYYNQPNIVTLISK